MTKTRLCIFALALILLFSLLSLQQIESIGTAAYSPDISPQVTLGEILEGTEITQTVPIRRDTRGISLLFATYVRKNSGLLFIQVTGAQSGRVYLDTQLRTELLSDNCLRTLPFQATASPQEDPVLLLTVQGNGTPGQAVTLWCSESDAVEGADLTLNGIPQPGELVYSLEETVPYGPLLIWPALFTLFCGIFLLRFLKSLRRDPASKCRLSVEEAELDRALRALLVLSAFTVYLHVAQTLPSRSAPDEGMRADLTYWICENGRLPIGNEPELINPTWGFSYAFTPYLPSMLASIFVWIAGIFTQDPLQLTFASRLINVLAGSGCVYFCLKLAPYLFKNKWSGYLFAVLVGFLPQFVFLCGYLNNDVISLLSCLSMLYFLVSGKEGRWPIKSCIGLGLSMAVCALTYFYAYGWLLICVLFCIVSCLRDPEIPRKGRFLARRAALVFGVFFLSAGWYFIRNAILYDGNFLGLGQGAACKQAYIAAGNSVYIPTPPAKEGVSLLFMLKDKKWILMTLCSLVGVFDYMTLYMDNYAYVLYYGFLGLGAILGFVFFLRRRKNALLPVSLILSALIPIGLSVYRSYFSDFQPQGRYIISALPALAIFTVWGYERLTDIISKAVPSRRAGRQDAVPVSGRGKLPLILAGLWLLLFLFAYHNYLVTILN